MPKISELPAGIALTGDELVDVVQNGVNVKVALKALMNAPRDVSVSNARWIQCSAISGIQNDDTLEITGSGGGSQS